MSTAISSRPEVNRSIILTLPVEMHAEIVQYLRPHWQSVATWSTLCRHVYACCKQLLYHTIPLSALSVLATDSLTPGQHPATFIRRLLLTPQRNYPRIVPIDMTSIIDKAWFNVENNLNIPGLLQLNWSFSDTVNSIFPTRIPIFFSHLCVLKVHVRHYDEKSLNNLVNKPLILDTVAQYVFQNALIVPTLKVLELSFFEGRENGKLICRQI